MPFEFIMPMFSDTMTEGFVAKWFVREGEFVARGTVVVELETDKAVMPCELCLDATLASLLVPAGKRAAVGAVLAVFALPGESVAEVRRHYETASSAPANPIARPHHKRKRLPARRLLLDRLRRRQP